MNLKPLGTNKTEVNLNDKISILFSYKTPVSYYDSELDTYFVTDKYYSRTTSRHINSWLKGINENKIRMIPQHIIDELVK